MAEFIGIGYSTWWFLLVGALFSGYVILDGFDLGAGALHLFFRDEKSRRIALNAVGPVWDGNEVWLVIGGGSLFAGFPVLYGTLLSSMYIPFMLFLLFIILRAVSIEFRGKETMKWWRKTWDISYSLSSSILAVLLGVVLGNILQGMPLGENFELVGSWLFFLNPYSIIVGLTTLALMTMHGAIYLSLKTEGVLFQQVRLLIYRSLFAFVGLFVIMSIYTVFNIPHLTDRFRSEPYLSVFPILSLLAIANVPRLVSKKKYLFAFLFSSLTFSFLLIMVAIELYPTLLLSTIHPDFSINIYNAASSDKTLGIMLLFALIGTPLVLTYTFIVYKTFWGKVKIDDNSY